MAFDKKVLLGVCRAPVGRGHNFVSFATSMAIQPATNNLIPQYEIHCTNCGATMEEASAEIRTSRSGPSGRHRKPAVNEASSLIPEPLE